MKTELEKLAYLRRLDAHTLDPDLATNAIVCWSTEDHGLAVGALRAGGRDVDD